jgi:4-diphosphocytidyl-2-C-methyl-D-erythritol kinase
MSSIKLKANAKINIGLEVLYRRNDNFHEINTIFYKINLYDDIIIKKNFENNNILIQIEPNINIPIEDNIVYKAAALLKSFFNIDYGADIFIKKNIPIGAGLGGGSSDAASTLLGLIEHWDIKSSDKNLFDKDLNSLASKLGSDVPFFLKDASAIGTSRGEVLDYFDYKLPYWILVVYPNIHISTKWAYEGLNRNNEVREASNLKKYLLDAKNDLNNFEYIKNDFEELVFNKYPEIKEIKSILYIENAIYSSLSGSGSAVYGFFDDEKKAVIASKRFANYFTYICLP